MKGFKQSAKMSHGGHYCWGGKVMKKREGGDVASQKVQKEDKDRYDRSDEGVKTDMGLPVSVYNNGKYDPKASEKMMYENFEEGIRQDREEHGRKMKEKYGTTEDYSYKFPSESYNSILPHGKSLKTQATEGFKRGGKVMKKADGGTVNLGAAPAMRGPGPDPFVGKGTFGGGRSWGNTGGGSIGSVGRRGLKPMQGEGVLLPVRDYNPRGPGGGQPVGRGMDANSRFARMVDKGRIGPEGNPANPAVRLKKGGSANWIQGAIKKPGALKKSLGVSADKPIPAAKLEKASKAPGKMGQRARLAKTLKGMK